MENLGFGLQVTVVGMAIVFGLLALLWLLLSITLRFDAPPVASAAAEAPAGAGDGTGANPGADGAGRPLRVTAPDGLDQALVAAIAIAVVTHTEARRRQAAPAMRSYWPGSLLYASRWVASGRTRQNRSWQRRSR